MCSAQGLIHVAKELIKSGCAGKSAVLPITGTLTACYSVSVVQCPAARWRPLQRAGGLRESNSEMNERCRCQKY